MKQNLFHLLGLKSRIIIFIGRFFNKILQLINYAHHLEKKKELKELFSDGYEVKTVNAFFQLKSNNIPYTIFIRPNSSDQSVLYQIWHNKEYLHLVNLIEKYNYKDKIKTVIDAGSNIGLTSLFFKHFYESAKVISIEPDYGNYTIQLKNIEINKFNQSNIIVLNSALWVNNTDKLIISNAFRDGNHWAKSVEVQSEIKEYVSAITLQEVLLLFEPTPFVDILKIDIEGSENKLFENDEFIKCLSDKVRFMSLEIHDEFNNRKKIQNILFENSFTVEDIGETTFCVNKNLI